MASRFWSPGTFRRPLFSKGSRSGRTLAALAVLLLCAGGSTAFAQAKAPTPPPPKSPPPTWAFGDRVVVRNCLRFIVSDYRDRQSDVDNNDWVKLRVESTCRALIRNLTVELLLVDAQNVRYGTPYGVLGRGEVLQPGDTWEEDIAIPDPDSRVARRWSLRVLRADGLPRPKPPAEQKDGAKDGKK